MRTLPSLTGPGGGKTAAAGRGPHRTAEILRRIRGEASFAAGRAGGAKVGCRGEGGSERSEGMLIRCPECREQISDQATACPRCGRPISDQDRKRARSAVATAKIGCLAMVVLVGVITLVSVLQTASRPRQPEPPEPVATEPVATQTTPNRQAKVKAWASFVTTDPKTKKVVQRVEIEEGSPARGIGVTVYLRPSSAIGKTAAKDPGAEPVEVAAKLLSASLWDYCRDDNLREVDVTIRLGKRDIGVAATGLHNGEVVTFYLPVGMLEK